jgi:hypothetical protein
MKYSKEIKYVALGAALFMGFQLSADIEQERTNSIGSGDWQTGLMTPSDSDANTACNVIAGLPFSCTLPTSGGGSVTCSPVSIPGGLTLSSGCVLAGSSPTDFSVDVQFDDGVSDPVTKTINLTAGPNQSPTATDPTCPTPKSGFAWSCDVASSVNDPEGQSLSYGLGTSAPSWASMSGSVISGTPDSSGSTAVPYTINDGVNTITYNYNITILAAGGELITDPSATTTEAALDEAGVDGIIKAAVASNTCGSDATQSCLDAFNSYKSSATSCTAPSADAGGDDMTAYVSCVMVAYHTQTASAVPTSNTESLSSGACVATVNLAGPAHCAHPNYTCEMIAKSSNKISYVNNNSQPQVNLASDAMAFSGTYTIRATLNYYDPQPTWDYSYSFTVPAGGSVTAVQTYTGSGAYMNAWNACYSRGGTMYTRDEYGLSWTDLRNGDWIYTSNANWNGNCSQWSYADDIFGSVSSYGNYDDWERTKQTGGWRWRADGTKVRCQGSSSGPWAVKCKNVRSCN